MDKNTILNYVTETPGNTNRAVLRSMLDSLDGGIEMVTLFDDDISGFTYTPSSQYGPATANLYNTIIPTSTVEEGFLKVTYEKVSRFVVFNKGSYNLTLSYYDSNLPFRSVGISSYYDPVDSVIIQITGLLGKDAELEAYSRESHHLKVEWFTV